MKIVRITVIILICIPSLSTAQISSFLGGSLSSGPGVVKANESDYALGYSGGISYVLWENPAWFFRSGIVYAKRTSFVNEFPIAFPNPGYEKLDMKYSQYDLQMPLQAFFPVIHNKPNALLLMGGLELNYTTRAKYENDMLGSALVAGSDLNRQISTAVSIGAGYLRRLDQDFYLNIYPSFNRDLRADKTFNYFKITLEIMYGLF